MTYPATHWLPITQYVPLPIDHFIGLDVFEPSSEFNQVDRNPRKFEGLIIGIGASGEKVIRNWLNLLEQDQSGWQERLQIMLITEKPAPADLNKSSSQDASFGCGVFLFPLRNNEDSSAQFSYVGDGEEKQRVERHKLFCKAAVYKPVYNHLNDVLRELQSGVKVILIGSLAEAEIGIIGDLLQILRLISQESGFSRYSGITAILTFSSPKPVLEEDEQYAALREIGRFTFSGIHWMEKTPWETNGTIHSALLDYLIIIDDHGLPPISLNLSQTSFEKGCGRALVEILYTLLHPSFHSIWESDIKTGLGDAANARNNAHQAFVSSFGIASLEIPLKALKDYVTNRMVYAALFGEPHNRRDDGFLSEARIPGQGIGENLAVGWLKTGPMGHSVIDWVLDNSIESIVRKQISLQDVQQYKIPFQGQLMHGVVNELNSDAPGRFTLSQASLDWLSGFIEERISWLEKGVLLSGKDLNPRYWKDLLHGWLETVENLSGQLKRWERALFDIQTPDRSINQLPLSNPKQKTLPWETWKNDPAPLIQSPPAKRPLPVIVEALESSLYQNFQKSQQFFVDGADNPVCKSVMQLKGDDLSEVRTFYEDTIRPELSIFGQEESVSFQRLKGRLGWWTELKPGKEPVLYLICVPADVSGLPQDVGRYTAENITEMAEVLGRNARILTGSFAPHLNRWFQKQMEHMPNFLERARLPFLNYDEDRAIRNQFLSSQPYLMGPAWINQSHAATTFPLSSEHHIKIIDSGETTRLTAMSLVFNIPLDSVSRVQQYKNNYTHKSQLHLYKQEQNAALYETRIRKLNRNWVELPPEIVLTLVDQVLVKSFFWALFDGLLTIQADDSETKMWVLKPIVNGDKFDKLYLFPAEGRYGFGTLFQAFNRFVLELPNDANQQNNPQNHFHVSRRSNYIKAIQETLQRSGGQLGTKPGQKDNRKINVEKFINQDIQDSLTKAFSCLLEVEWDELMWK